MNQKKFDISDIEMEDIQEYSFPAYEENMQNIADRFKRETNKATASRKGIRNSFKIALAAASLSIMIFSASILASADFREAIFGIFTETQTEEMIPGLESDNNEVFTVTQTDEVRPGLERHNYEAFNGVLLNENVLMLDGVVTTFDIVPTGFRTDIDYLDFYEYVDGNIVKIKNVNKIDLKTKYDGVDYHIIFKYYVKNNGELVVNKGKDYLVNNDVDEINVGRVTSHEVQAIPGRTDAVLLTLRYSVETYALLHMHATVIFDLTTHEITDNIFPNNVAGNVAFNTDGTKALFESFEGPGPHNFPEDPENVYLTDLNTGKTIELPNKFITYCGWADKDSFLYFYTSQTKPHFEKEETDDTNGSSRYIYYKGDYARYNTVTGEEIMLTEGANLIQALGGSMDVVNDYYEVRDSNLNYGRLCINTGEIIIADDTFYSSRFVPNKNGEWFAYTKKFDPDYLVYEESELYIHNADSGKTINVSQELLGGKLVEYGALFCWLDDQVLGVLVKSSDQDGTGQEISGDAINIGMNRYLYVLKIDDSFEID